MHQASTHYNIHILNGWVYCTPCTLSACQNLLLVQPMILHFTDRFLFLTHIKKTMLYKLVIRFKQGCNKVVYNEQGGDKVVTRWWQYCLPYIWWWQGCDYLDYFQQPRWWQGCNNLVTRLYSTLHKKLCKHCKHKCEVLGVVMPRSIYKAMFTKALPTLQAKFTCKLMYKQKPHYHNLD